MILLDSDISYLVFVLVCVLLLLRRAKHSAARKSVGDWEVGGGSLRLPLARERLR